MAGTRGLLCGAAKPLAKLQFSGRALRLLPKIVEPLIGSNLNITIL